MKAIAITQRVAIEPRYKERRDCLDQAWTRFMTQSGLLPVPMPNHPPTALALCAAACVEGLVLTGGGDLAAYGGEAPERDETELALLAFAEQRALPVLGVCRGMQVIQHRFGMPLHPVTGHVTPRHCVTVEGRPMLVNSYHRFAAYEARSPLEVWAVATDGVIEAIRHISGRLIGIMWHPERMAPVEAADLALFRRVFGTTVACAP